MHPSPLPEIGFYALAGGATNPRDLIDEIATAESLGLGSAFISERLNLKEAATVGGAIGALSVSIGIATAVTNYNVRNPLVTAAHANTMQALTGGRYTLGIGRGINSSLGGMGLSQASTAEMEDFANLIRAVLSGDPVVDHRGAAGAFPYLQIRPRPSQPTPLLMTAFGPQSLRLAARTYDAAVLHTFFSDETTVRCVRTVRQECERIGRDPEEVRIWSCYATVRTDLPHEIVLKKTIGRLASYLQGYGDLLVKTNKWDPAVLKRFRNDDVVQSIRGAIDTIASPEQLEHIGKILPAEWLSAAAVGPPDHCARLVSRQFDLGVDGVIMHGSAPDELKPVIDRYREIRSPATHNNLPRNPGQARRIFSESTSPRTRDNHRASYDS